MSKAIARGSQARGKARAPARGKAQRGRAPAPAPALSEAVRRLSWWIFFGMMIALGLALLWALRIPQMVGGTLGESVGEMGFAMKRVEIKGAAHIRQIDVYNIAFDQPSTAMPLVDLEGTRQRLLRFGWVRDARVSRRLPDTLVVDIVERRPAAIWQHNQKLALIDVDGVVLEAVRLDAMPDLPLLIGPAANLHAAELARLTEVAPNLKPAMAGASWVGGRRWDLRFQTGEVLALPEGEAAARKALTKFASMDQSVQLLGKGYVRIDMRDPRRMLIRLSSEPGSTVPEIAPEAPPAAPGSGTVDTART
ncbi:MAG TPA: cell division protein FtsQ/DivIB, partial [Allosphingosinicella sp.]|nr:cell division protein FtsQ/DivIB [Allosphingosinicella sp.]